MKRFLSILISILFISVNIFADTGSIVNADADKDTFYVAVNGNDSDNGGESTPFATIKKAFEVAKNSSKNNVEIIVKSGTYNFSNTITVSGLNSKNVAVKGEGDVNFYGTTKIDDSCVTSITNSAILNRLNEDVQSHIVQINLPTDLKNVFTLSETNIPRLYQCGERLSLSRWPDFDYHEVESVPDEERNMTTIGYTNEDIDNWDVTLSWMDHYGNNDWCRDFNKIASVDSTNNTITINENASYKFNAGKRWSVVNVLEEVNLPGEYYIDYTNDIIYVYPMYEGNYDFEAVNIKGNYILSLTNCSNITFDNIEFGMNNENKYAIYVLNSNNITVENCTFRDTAGVQLYNSTNCTVDSNTFYNMTGVAVRIDKGGDRASLTSSNNAVTNNHISSLGGYRSGYGLSIAIQLSGTSGVTVQNNIIHGNAVGAISFENGNNGCLVSNNEIYNVINSVADAGAFYAGYNWGSYGNQVSDNYIHDFNGKSNYISEGNNGIYLDDWFSGMTVTDNVLGNNSTDIVSSRGIYVASGRDNTVSGNLMFNLQMGLYATNRFQEDLGGLSIPSVRKLPYMVESLNIIGDGTTALATTYPKMVELKTELFEAYTNKEYEEETYTVTDAMKAFWRTFPKNNTIKDNVSYGGTFNIDSRLYNSDNNITSNVRYDAQFPTNHNGVEKVGYSGSAFALGDFSILYPYDQSVDSELVDGNNLKVIWENSDFADEYYYEISTTADFTDIIVSGTTISNGADITGLDGSNRYYMRVTAKNTSAKFNSQKTCDAISFVTKAGEYGEFNPTKVIASGDYLALTFDSEVTSPFFAYSEDGARMECKKFNSTKDHTVAVKLDDVATQTVRVTNGSSSRYYRVDKTTHSNSNLNNKEITIGANDKLFYSVANISNYSVTFDIKNSSPDFRLFMDLYCTESSINGYRYAVRDFFGTYWNGILLASNNSTVFTQDILNKKEDTDYLTYLGTKTEAPKTVTAGCYNGTQCLFVNGELRKTQTLTGFSSGGIKFTATGSSNDVVINNVKITTSTVTEVDMSDKDITITNVEYDGGKIGITTAKAIAEPVVAVNGKAVDISKNGNIITADYKNLSKSNTVFIYDGEYYKFINIDPVTGKYAVSTDNFGNGTAVCTAVNKADNKVTLKYLALADMSIICTQKKDSSENSDSLVGVRISDVEYSPNIKSIDFTFNNMGDRTEIFFWNMENLKPYSVKIDL